MRNLVTLLVVALTSATAASLPITSSPAYAALRQQTAGNILPLAQAACVGLTGPGEIPAPGFVTFDDLAAGTSIGSFYQRSHGVRFEDIRTARVIAYDHPLPRSAPMTALSQTDGDPAQVALNFYFDTAQAYVGMYVGNGGGVTTAQMQGFDADGNLICEAEVTNVPDNHTAFIGFRDDAGRVISVSLTYLSAQAESLDDLYFSAALPATATPTPTATPTVTGSPTAPPTSTPTPTAPASSTAALFAYPAQVAPGGQPMVNGYGFPALAELRLILVCPNRTEFDLGGASTDTAGRLLAVGATLPAYPPNPCVLAARQGPAALATADLTIRPALELSFSPQNGPPGTMVSFTVRNLAAGSLRVDYAGAAVVGPLSVAAGDYSGSFTVPGDRPAPLGAPTGLRATNLSGSLVLGQVEQSFGSQPGDAPPLYQVTGMNAPLVGVAPGGMFVLTGLISPPPPPGQATVLPVWKTAAGKLFPVGMGQAVIHSNGSFEVAARVPSLQAGDPFLPQDGDQVGVAVVTADGQASANLAATGAQWLYPGLNVKAVVVGSNPARQIQGAVITVSAWPGALSADSASQQANAVFSGAVNQIAGSNNDDGELTEAEKLMTQIQLAACPLVGIPVAESDLVISVVSPPLEENLGQPATLAQMLVNTQLTTPGDAAALDAATKQTDAAAAGSVLQYLVTVDAIAQGYGVLGDDNLPRTTSFRVDYHTADQSYRTPQGALLPDPIVVALPPLPAWATSQLGEIKAVFESLTVEPETTPGAIPRFSRYYSLVGLPAGIAAPASTSVRVVAILTVGQQHLLSDKGLNLYVDGVHKAKFDIQFSPGITCNIFKGAKVNSKPFYVATATLPNPHLLAPGLRAIRIGATLQADPGKETSYYYNLRMEALPASWFTVQNQGTRSIEWRPWAVTFYSGWLSETGSKQVLSSGAKTPQTGPLESNARANVMFTYSAQANGVKSSLQGGQTTGKALNKDGAGAAMNPVAATSKEYSSQTTPTTVWAVNGVTKQIGPTTETLVPPITFDLPEAKYGIPFVAEVAAGGSVAYGASVTYAGTITVQDDGAVQSMLTIDPEADTSGTVYVEGRLLTGLIGKAGASLTANFDLHMPVTYDTAQTKPLTAGTYFEYGADFKVWHKWGCVPYAGCAYSKTYNTHLFDDCEQLEGSTGCSAAASARAARIDAADEPPQFDIHLAANSQGALMAIWPASLTSLATSLYDGYAWSTPQTIATGVGSSDPHVVFLAPNKALAVWVETTLPPGQTAAFYASIPITAAVKSQRLAYALWNGAGWSSAAALTTPLHGEGNLALAACTDDPACPASGGATLVWQRYMTADPLQRQISLYYASYQSDAWSTAQAVDPSSTTTDILPQVAYRNGAPLVAWVRDSDTDMTDVTSRRVALRTLGGPILTPPELPNAIGEIGLAVGKGGQIMLAFTRAADGGRLLDNRRPLWFATASCADGACAWTPTLQRDPFGRPIYAERPLVTRNDLDQPTVTFRGMGFGPDQTGQRFVVPGDPPGMVFSTGELAQVLPHGAGGSVAPLYLTQDGAINWMPTAVFNSMASSTAALVVKGAAPVAQAGATGRATYAAPDPNLPVSFALAPELPDFVVAAVEFAHRYPQPGAAISVTIRLLNQGAPWPPGDGAALAVAATWDGEPGVGAPAGAATLRSLDAGGATVLTLVLTPPPGSLNVEHTLHVTVNPRQVTAESDAEDNSLVVTVGGVPPPAGLNASVQAGGWLVFLQWTPSDDVRIAGYRVYRAAGAGPFAPAGSSLVAGWVDPAAAADVSYRYAVAAYTADGIESPLGSPVAVAMQPRHLFLPLVERG